MIFGHKENIRKVGISVRMFGRSYALRYALLMQNLKEKQGDLPVFFHPDGGAFLLPCAERSIERLVDVLLRHIVAAAHHGRLAIRVERGDAPLHTRQTAVRIVHQLEELEYLIHA